MTDDGQIVAGQTVAAALGLLLGGILGNLIDRIKLVWVTDFIYFFIV